MARQNYVIEITQNDKQRMIYEHTPPERSIYPEQISVWNTNYKNHFNKNTKITKVIPFPSKIKALKYIKSINDGLNENNLLLKYDFELKDPHNKIFDGRYEIKDKN